MTLLDTLAGWIQRLLSALLPPELTNLLWFPVLVAIVLIALRTVVRHALPVLGRATATVLRALIVALGALLLLPELATATVFRRVGTRPPGFVYGYGDTVAGCVIGLTGLAGATASGISRASRVNMMIIVLLSALWLWGWNQSHCGDPAAPGACVRPVAQWMDTFGN